MPSVDWEAVKQQQQAMNATVLQRTKDHPPKSTKTWKYLAIFVPIFLAMIAFTIWALVAGD